MQDFKLKIVLSILSAIVFSFIFILLAFVLPLDKDTAFSSKPKNKLEAVSQSLK
ncbi:hypothetical protein KJ870_11565 [bacterium]|jgi:hypothetical protein|nr:hypothetical protein [bacterium]MBU1435570.1 hypothetical protein [bacterium]MBU1502506.1 hypothetical protein [bacterium]MBU3938149.1 hypothetical protein [bacterium]MBU4025757.1 hypothetical protein [bacterium]